MKMRGTKDCLFEEAEGDGEQVMQRADAKKFEEEQKSDESLKAWWKLAEDKYEPCTILERRSKYSYIVNMGNDFHKIIHANKIRKYYTRALACGLIAEEDEEFGAVIEVPLKNEEQRKETLSIDAEQINHLSTEQQGQLLTTLKKYQDRFTEKTELCTLVEHEMELKPDFRAKEFAAYRIPFAYRPEVERQIQDMLQQGIIKPYSRRMALPRVFGKKKNGLLCQS